MKKKSKSIYYKSRIKSLLDDTLDVEHLAEIKNFPIFIGATDQPEGEDFYYDLTFDICKSSGCVQIRNLIDPNLIYSGYHSEALGAVWFEHHSMFSTFSQRYLGKKILEIGGSNGILANQILSKKSSIESYEIVEPNPSISAINKIKVTDGFFSNEFVEKLTDCYDTVLHSHTLEHSYDPINFVEAISRVVPQGSYQILSVPNLESYLENKFSNVLNFEHTFMLTNEVLLYLMENNGFELIEKEYFQNHSVFYAFKKTNESIKRPLKNNYLEQKEKFTEYFSFFKNEVTRLNKNIKNFDGRIYIFGAHVFSQFLLANGLHENKISGIIDNSKEKNSKRLYGSSLRIFFPSEVENHHKVAVILKAGQYQEEVKKQLNKINSNIVIWE